MAGQKTLTLLIVFLSLACILGRPADENLNDQSFEYEDMYNEDTSNEELEPKHQLIVDTFRNYRELTLNYVNEAQNITKDILKDETLLAHSSSPEIKEFQKNLTDFREKYKRYLNDVELNYIADIFADTTEFYMKLPKENITPETAVIIDTLRKYGTDKFEKKFEQLSFDFVEKFKQQFENTKEYLKEETGLLEWFDHFIPLTNLEDQAAAFEALGELYRFY